MSLKDRVEGNELDLSLNQLTDVPVKELAATPKATHLDLSCNMLQTLPNDFATLVHLVKIDLSRNKLTELPHNFGNLLNLQYLDLDKNELKNVPLSFCRLRNLRWLDLKDNPLEPKLKAVAGDCLDEKQCLTAAKKVVSYMQNIESNLEREKQKSLKEMREKEAQEKAKVEKELEVQRKQKKLEKERRKALSRARNEEKQKQHKESMGNENNMAEATGKDGIIHKRKGMHWCMWFLPLIIAVLAIFFYIAANDFPLHKMSKAEVKSFVQKHSLKLSKDFIKFWKSSIIPFVLTVKTSLLKNVHSTMLYISNVASQIELYLSFYF